MGVRRGPVLSLRGHRGILRPPQAPRPRGGAARKRPGPAAEEATDGAEGDDEAQGSTCDPGAEGEITTEGGDFFRAFFLGLNKEICCWCSYCF